MKKWLLLLSQLVFHTYLVAQFTDRDIKTTTLYFNEANQLAKQDQSKLWGTSMYGPMIFINPETRDAVANELDSAKIFRKINGVYTGKIPLSLGAANTAQAWGGKVWVIIRWPLPGDKYERASLMMHESYHRLQKLKNLPATDANCGHLDKFEGRLLLKMELEALRKIIVDYPSFSIIDLQNAIALRNYRYKKFPKADSLERRLELNEGIAEFTGLMLSGRTLAQKKEKLVKGIDEFYGKPSFVRSMAYVTGPVYGFLLSDKNQNWNKRFITNCLKIDDFSFQQIISKSYKINYDNNADRVYQTTVKNNLYGYEEIYKFEKNREDIRQQLLSENKKKFIDGPVLTLPNINMNFVFNPNEVQMIDEYGPVYPTFSSKADWGTLEVKKGGVFIQDWMKVFLPLSNPVNLNDTSIENENWQLQLKQGWKIKEGKRKGDYEITRSN